MTNISRAWTYICLCFCDMWFHIAPQTINKTTSKATNKPTNTPSEVVLDSAPHDDSTLIWSRTSCLTQRIPRSVVPSSHVSLQERLPELLIVQLMVGTLRGLNTSTSAPAQKSRFKRYNYHEPTNASKSKLFAHPSSILISPSVVAKCHPTTIVTYFDSSLVVSSSTHQSNVPISTISCAQQG